LIHINPGGTWHFRAKDCFAEECVLALAFEAREDLRDTPSRCVTSGSVSRAFDLRLRSAYAYGFFSHERRGVTSALLDAMWEEAIRTLPIHYQMIRT
jgi:hypothetical protein